MKKAKKQIKSKVKVTLRKRNKDLPVTQGQFSEFRSEINSKFTSVELEFKAVRSEIAGLEKRIDARFCQVDARFSKIDERFSQIDARFSEIDARFSEIDARFAQVDARFAQIDARFLELNATLAKMDAKIETLVAAMHRVLMIVEEQNGRNQFVLDGYENLGARIDSNYNYLNERLTNIETVIKLAKTKEPTA